MCLRDPSCLQSGGRDLAESREWLQTRGMEGNLMQKLQDEKSLQHPGELHKIGLRRDAVKSLEQH